MKIKKKTLQKVKNETFLYVNVPLRHKNKKKLKKMMEISVVKLF